jgi:hypothetical protein
MHSVGWSGGAYSFGFFLMLWLVLGVGAVRGVSVLWDRFEH